MSAVADVAVGGSHRRMEEANRRGRRGARGVVTVVRVVVMGGRASERAKVDDG